MSDYTFSLSKEARQRRPYQSLIAAILFQSFQDALSEAANTLSRDDANAVAPARTETRVGGFPLPKRA
jgi:hypothetical protein